MQTAPKNQLDLSLVGYPLFIQFSTWDKGIGWTHIRTQKSEVAAYFESPSFSIDYLSVQEELHDWVKSIPKDVLTAALEFELRYVGHVFTALFFASRSKAAKELFINAPILSWLILEYACNVKLDENKALKLFNLKRTQILELHGIEPRKANLKFLYRINEPRFGYEGLELIKTVFQIHDIIKLNRISYPSFTKLEWLIDSPQWIDAAFMKNEKINTNVYAFKTYVNDTLRMANDLQINNIISRISECKNQESVVRLHDQLIPRINSLTQDHLRKIPFPTPPLKEDLGVTAILNYDELNNEGKSMHHCILSYRQRIISGEYYVYKICAPQRATIGLRLANGQWAIDQIKLVCNGMPSDETKEWVYKWLSNATSCNGE